MAGSKAARLWLGSLLICTWAASAQAEECQKNEDCPKGFSCEVSTAASDCDAAPPCEPGADCPEPAPCDAPVETHTCQPASCAVDADCGEGMVCFKETFTECSGGGAPACGPGEVCAMPAPPDEPSCSEQVIALCIPRYVLPCEQDLDCGEGFSCEAGEQCMCSGSSGDVADGGTAEPDMGEDFAGFAPVPPADAGTDRPLPAQDAAVGGEDPTCECRPTERKHCELKVMSCSTDADCPRDFACKPYGGDDVATCSSSDSGDAICASEPAAPTALRCVPRYDWPTRGGTKGEDSSSDGPTYEEGEGSNDAGDPDGGVAAAPQAPGDGDTGAPVAETGSCSVSAPRGGAFGSLFAPVAFVLLALGVRTRRKQR
jgi:hypothetical protein